MSDESVQAIKVHKDFEVVRDVTPTGDIFHKVYYRGECVFEWYANANQDYPEDLTWNREISDIFYEGIKLGQRMKQDEMGGLLRETQKLCSVICNNPPETPIKGEIESRAFSLAHDSRILNA